VLGDNKRRAFHLLVLAILTVSTLVIGPFLTSQSGQRSWWSRGAWIVAGIIVYFLYLWWQARSQAGSLHAIKERVTQLEPELRKQVQARSYGARRNLIETPLRELELDVTPRLGWVRDPRLVEPEPVSEKIADDIVAAFESSKRRLLIVGEPGSGKTMAAYSLIEYLDEREGAEGRVPLLVNLSAWEAQETFEAFLVDYLGSSVGYEVPERAVARAFISSDGYDLILDGLDEIPLRLRAHFSEQLDEFVRGLAGEVGVVVTCRTQEYEELLAAHATGLGLVQAVEILPLSSEQLDSAFVELAKRDKDWETFLSQRDLTAYKRVRHLLSNPLFLNLAVVGHLSPEQLLDATTTEQDLRDLVLESYLDSTLADQRDYEPQDARRYLSWIARFLNGVEVSPFGLKTSDYTVFDLADLTPPVPPRRYRLFEGLVLGLGFGLGFSWSWKGGSMRELVEPPVRGLVLGLGLALPTGWPFKRSAVSSRVTLASWPSTRQQLLGFLRRAGRGLVLGLLLGLFLGLLMGLVAVLGSALDLVSDWHPSYYAQVKELGLFMLVELLEELIYGLVFGLGLALVFVLGFGLLETRSVLLTSRTPKEARSRSLIAALTWLVSGLVGGWSWGWAICCSGGWAWCWKAGHCSMV
jgi:NACHT domain